MDVRVELPAGRNLGQPFLDKRASQRLLHESHTLDEGRFLVTLGGLQCALETVENRQQLTNEPFVRMRDEALLLARRPLAVVLEVGLDALQETEVLVALLGQLEQRFDRGCLIGPSSASGVRPVGSDPLPHPGSDPSGPTPRRPSCRRAAWSRLRGLFLVDDLEVGVLYDLVVCRAAVPRRLRGACADACA